MKNDYDIVKELSQKYYPAEYQEGERRAFERGYKTCENSVRVDIAFWSIVSAFAGFAIGALMFLVG